MRTMILTLALVLLAAPAWAVVYITATDEGGGVVRIDYESVGEPNLPRAFALDIMVSEGNITDCCDYAVGDNNKGFGIFPGSFGVLYVDPDTGLVESWEVGGYTPVADPGTHPTALGGIDTNGITIEMGSLYDTNAPETSGTLCRVIVSTNPCTLSVSLNALSGNVVMEDANEPTGGVDLSGATIQVGDGECFPSDHPDYDTWVAVGKPDCWCPENNPRQCHGDTNGEYEGGTISGYYYVGYDDIGLLVTAWKVLEDCPTMFPDEPLKCVMWPGGPPTPSGPGIASVTNGICADFAHAYEGGTISGYYYVGYDDMGILVSSWKVLEDCPSMFPGDPLKCVMWPGGPPTPSGPGIAPDCPD
jgi:hypothetical protein